MAVDDLPFEAVQYACKQVFRSETFMPVPAIVRSYAKEWQTKQRMLAPTTEHEQLSLRDALVTPAEVRALLAEVWPEDAQ